MKNDELDFFLNAADIRQDNGELYKNYLFEEEIKSIWRLIIWARSRDYKYVTITDISDEARLFLEERCYVVNNTEDNKVLILW